MDTIATAAEFMFEAYKQRTNELRQALQYLEKMVESMDNGAALAAWGAEVKGYLIGAAPVDLKGYDKVWQHALQKVVDQYVESVTDDQGDEWDYEEERTLTCREEARRTLACFMDWVSENYARRD